MNNSDDPDTETVVTPAAPVAPVEAAAPVVAAPVAPVAPVVAPVAAVPVVAPVAPVAAPAPVAPVEAAAPVADDRDSEIVKLKTQIAQQAISTALADVKVGAREPAVVALLIDAAKAETPEGLKAEIARVKSEYPGQFYGPGDINGGNRGGGGLEVTPGFDRVKNFYKTSLNTR